MAEKVFEIARVYTYFLVQGILKGFDQLNNLVLEQAVEEEGISRFLLYLN